MSQNPPLKEYNMPLVNCNYCNNTIYKIPSKVAINKNNFCNPTCMHAYQKLNRKCNVCIICGTKFIVSSYITSLKYCSHECRRVSSISRRVAFSNCQVCGKTFHDRGTRHKYCSYECRITENRAEGYAETYQLFSRLKNKTGEGIEWETFDDFINDMGYKPTKHRLIKIDKDKNFSKDNCKWQLYKKYHTMKVQTYEHT